MSHSDVNPTDANEEPLFERVIADYIRSCETGQPVDRQQLLNKHSEFAAELRQFFGQRDRMNQLANPIRGFANELDQPVGPGQQISYVGNYELLQEVARGGMGIVYKARQATLGRIVAVKMIVAGRLASEDDVKRFQVEASAAASLQHPNIVAVHEVGQHEGWHYFSMDFVNGRDLSAILRENLLPAKQAARYVEQMAEAIHYAHQQGTLHRDLKPSNILIDDQDQVRITDFGLAMRVEGDSDLTRTGQIVGTPSYMPPEQAQGKRSLIGPASDVYALGAVLYECLTGRPPFRAQSVIETIHQVIHTEAPLPRLLNPGIPKDLETICLKCLQKAPHFRYGTAQLLADDLGHFLAGEPIVARPISRPARIWRWCHRNPGTSSLFGLLAIVVVVGISIGTWQWARANTEWRRAEVNLDKASEESRRYQQAAANAVAEQMRAEAALGRLKDEQARSESLQAGIGVLENRRAELKQEFEVAQRRLSQTYVHLAGMLQKSGDVPAAERFLELCPVEHRSWEWNYYKRQFQPLFDSLSLSQRQDLLDGRLSLVLQGQESVFSPTGNDESLLPEERSGVEKAVATALEVSFEGLPPGTAKLLKRASHWESRRVAVAVHWKGYRKDNVCRVVILSTASGNVERIIPWDSNMIQALAISTDGRWLACGNPEAATVWDLATDFQGLGLAHHVRPVYRVGFSPDGIHLAALHEFNGTGKSPDRTGVSIYNARTGEHVCRLPCMGEKPAELKSVGFSSDGSRVAAIGSTGFRVWSLPDRRETIVSIRPGFDLRFHPDGRVFTTGERYTEVWDLDQGRCLVEIPEGGTGIAVHPYKDEIAITLGRPQNQVMVLDGRTLGKLRSIPTNTTANRLQYSPDGTLLAVAEGRVQQADVKELIQIFDSLSGERRLSFRTDGDEYVFDVAFSPDGMVLASANSNAIYLWDVITGQNILQLKVPDKKKRTLTKSGQSFHSTDVHHRGYSVSFSPDGKRLAAGWGPDQANVIIWDTGLGDDALARSWVKRGVDSSRNTPEVQSADAEIEVGPRP